MCYLSRGRLREVENKAALTFPEMRTTAQGRLKNKFKSFHFISLCIAILYFLTSAFIFISKLIFYKNIEYTATKYNNVKRMLCVAFPKVRIRSDFELQYLMYTIMDGHFSLALETFFLK